MAYEVRDNSGTLFKNDRKEKDTHPNATGKAMIDGRIYYVSAWTKDGAKGKFQSLAFKLVESDAADDRRPAVGPRRANGANEREHRAAEKSGQTQMYDGRVDVDDEIPF